MDLDRKKRRQSLKVILSEIIMVIAVVAMVVVLALIVSGYWLNSDFKVERQGLLQISSIPTGADVEIDGESSWLQRTNTSKVLTSGEHSIILTKDGYDSWSKTVNISEGLLYRIHYPRLFLKERTPEKVLDVTGMTAATVSPNRNLLLLINNTTEWTLINLSNEKIEPKKINVSDLFSSVSLADGAATGLFTGEILDMDWDFDSTHVLFEIKNNESVEWVLLDVKNPKNSTNLSKEFSSDFTKIEILDNSANNLLAVRNQNLQKINVSGKSISSILVENIVDFDHFNDELVFSALSNEDNELEKYYIGIMKVDDDKFTELTRLNTPSKVTISKFYDDKYISVLAENRFSLYKKADFEEIFTEELNFSPETLKSGHNGEFSIMTSGQKIATLDMESMKIIEWDIENANFSWIDNDMIYVVDEGNLIVYDFDGLNRRLLSRNVSGHFPVMITENKWLYYFSDGNLIREVINN